MRLSHSKSSRVKSKDSSDNDDSGNQKKVKRSKSVFFDPTTQVNRPFPDLIWKMAFHRLPLAEKLNGTALTSDQVMDLLHCTLLSNAVYYKKNKRNLPPNLSNIVYECKVSDFYRVPYFVVNSEELDTIFIVFRGSACLKDWHVDFLAAAIQFGRGHVHEGVYFTSLNIFNDIKEKIRDLSKSNHNRKVIITGHSLGGAVAGMTSILFNEEISDVSVRSICLAPVASLSPEIWEMTHNYIQSYINYGDLVPFISYYNTYYLPENSLPKLTHDQLVHWCIKKINKHSKRPEFRLLVETYTEPLSIPYKLVPPGVSYLIRVVDKKNATIEMQAIEDSMSYFGQFVKNLSAMKHPIKLYKNSVIRYFCQFFDQDDKLIDYYFTSKKKPKHRLHKSSKKNENKKGKNENESSGNQQNYSNESIRTSSNENYSNESIRTSSNENYSNENKSNKNSSSDYDDDDDENGNYNDDDDDEDDENNANYNDVYNDDDDDDDENENNDDDDDDDDGVEEKYYKYE